MPVAIVKLSEEANRVINIVKAKYGLKDKSEAINQLAIDFEKQAMEPRLRPEYVRKLKRISKQPAIKVKNVSDYLESLKPRR